MANMSLKKNPMPSQDPNVRNKNFDEVALGYTEEQALDEAQRCLHCKNKPCMQGCPVMVHIPDFIAEVAKGDFEAAYQIIAATSALPAVCGRVCPQESQCEKYCVRGIKGEPVGIGRLERFVADWHREHASGAAEKPASNGHRVAVVGSGPSGLTCAGDLARRVMTSPCLRLCIWLAAFWCTASPSSVCPDHRSERSGRPEELGVTSPPIPSSVVPSPWTS